MNYADLDRKVLELVGSLIHAKEYFWKVQEALNAIERDSVTPFDSSRPKNKSPGRLYKISLSDEELKMLLVKRH